MNSNFYNYVDCKEKRLKNSLKRINDMRTEEVLEENNYLYDCNNAFTIALQKHKAKIKQCHPRQR